MTDINKVTNDSRQRLKSRLLHIWRRHVRPILVIVIVLTTFRSAIADWNDVPTGSMKPSILEGDRIFVNKLAYGLKIPFTTIHLARWNTPERGEIVIFFSPEDGTRLVKRVIGLPGDTIEMRNGRLFINGQAVEYATVDPGSSERSAQRYNIEQLAGHPHPTLDTPGIANPKRWMAKQVVPAGHYFVLGDNRDLSRDSRWIGFIPQDQIVGRSSRVAMSLDYENWYLPRWGRFFKELP